MRPAGRHRFLARVPLPPRSAAEGFALQQRNWKLLGVEGTTRSDYRLKSAEGAARRGPGGIKDPGRVGRPERVGTRGGFWARREAPSLHGSGGAGRPGLRDLPARRPHALRAGGSPPQPGPPQSPRGGRRRCWRAVPGFHFYNPGGEGSHAIFLGQGVSSPGRTQSLLVIRTWVTFGNKTRSDRMYETHWEPELLHQ